MSCMTSMTLILCKYFLSKMQKPKAAKLRLPQIKIAEVDRLLLDRKCSRFRLFQRAGWQLILHTAPFNWYAGVVYIFVRGRETMRVFRIHFIQRTLTLDLVKTISTMQGIIKRYLLPGVLFHPSWPPEVVLSTGYLPSRAQAGLSLNNNKITCNLTCDLPDISSGVILRSDLFHLLAMQPNCYVSVVRN